MNIWCLYNRVHTSVNTKTINIYYYLLHSGSPKFEKMEHHLTPRLPNRGYRLCTFDHSVAWELRIQIFANITIKKKKLQLNNYFLLGELLFKSAEGIIR